MVKIVISKHIPALCKVIKAIYVEDLKDQFVSDYFLIVPVVFDKKFFESFP